MSEHRLQIAAATFLSAVLPRDCYWTSVDAGQGAMNIRAAQMRKARGVRAGFVDMLVVWGGRFYGVELKGSKGRLSDIQQITHSQIRDAGGQVEVCHSVEELERALRHWGIPLRGHTLTAAERDARLQIKKPARSFKPRADKYGAQLPVVFPPRAPKESRSRIAKGNAMMLAMVRGE